MRTKEQITCEIKVKEQELEALREELSTLNKKISRDSSRQYTARKNMLNEASKIWESILKPGDIIKVTGSRAGAYRKVLHITPGEESKSGFWWCGTVTTACCRMDRKGNITCKEYDIIQCGTNKIVSRQLVDGTWESASDIVKSNIDI